MDAGKFQEGSNTIAKTTDDKPVKSSRIVHFWEVSSAIQGDGRQGQHRGYTWIESKKGNFFTQKLV